MTVFFSFWYQFFRFSSSSANKGKQKTREAIVLRYFQSEWPMEDRSNIRQTTSTKNPILTKKITNEILSELKPVALDTYEFKN